MGTDPHAAHARLDAMKDSLIVDERTLEGVLDFDLAARLVRMTRCKLDLLQTVMRIRHSSFAGELLPYAVAVQGITSSEEMLAAARIVVQEHEAFGVEAHASFADTFWHLRVLEHVRRGDFEQAWRLLKLAAFGEAAFSDRSCHDYVLPGQVEGEPIGLTATNSGAQRIVRDFYAVLEEKGMLGDLLIEQIAPAGFGTILPPGLPLARMLDGFAQVAGRSIHFEQLNAIGVMVLAIGRAVHDPQVIAAARMPRKLSVAA